MKEFRLKGLSVLNLQPLTAVLMPEDWVMLKGPSGSGKSRLLRAIADIDEHQGSASLDGETMDAMPAPQWRRRVQYVPAESGWWSERVEDHFDHCEALKRYLSSLDLNPTILNASVSTLSSGERQRLAIIRSLLLAPAVLLLDEPTSNLDPALTQSMEQLINDYNRRNRCAVIWVTHDSDQYSRLGNRRWYIERARVIEMSSSVECHEKPTA